MDSREPNLLHVLVGTTSAAKKVLAEERPPLIDGNCMPHDMEIGVTGGRREREMDGAVDPAHRADGVPDSHEVRLALARERLFEIRCDRKINALALNHPDGVRDQAFVAFGKEPDNMKHATKCTGGVGPAAEAKDVQTVARFERPHQELVCVCDVIRNAIAEREANHAGPPFAYPSERVPRAQ